MSVKIKLFLDDDCHSTERRRLAEGYDVWVDRAQDAIAYLSKGNVSHISLDHDLGDQDLVGSGYDVAKWIEEAAYEGKIPRLEWRCHSANPVGRRNMEKALESADNFWSRGRGR